MVNHKERAKRALAFRKWYYRLPSPQKKSQMKHSIMQNLHISHAMFYQLLCGRIYINDYRAAEIARCVGCNIFTQQVLLW